jgi:uncharacterized protein YoxC
MDIFMGILVVLIALAFTVYVFYLGRYIKAIESKLVETINKVNELDSKSIYYEIAYNEMRDQRDKELINYILGKKKSERKPKDLKVPKDPKDPKDSNTNL